ncbi:MAG: RNA polymerase sigma factor [Hyphomicrobiales bacterium]
MQDSWPLSKLASDEREQAPLLDYLAGRAAEGDRHAFEQIYNILADELYAYLRGQCHDDTVAEDLLANTFLKAWRSARRYRTGTDQFRRWIFAIARNEIRDHWRHIQRTLPIVDLDLAEDSPPFQEDPADVHRLVRQALSVLTEDQRQVVVLRYFSGKSHEEIARIMGKREGAVRQLLLRALRRMRKAMADAAP